MKNKRKNIKMLIVFFAVLAIVLLVLMGIIYFSDTNMAKVRVDKVNSLESDYSDYIMPLNRRELMDAYVGNLSKETIYTLLYEFALDTIPKMRKEGVDNIEEYFEKNKEYIYIKTGIENVENYKKLAEKIKVLPENLTLSSTEIKENSVNRQNVNISGTMVVYYNDNATSVDIDIVLENANNTERTSILFN